MHIDAEVYFWKNEKAFRNPVIRENKILQQQYLPEQIIQSMHRNSIDGCLAVVGEPEEVETRFLAELAVTHREIIGVIGWINLRDPAAVEKIHAFHTYTPIRGYMLEVGTEEFPSPEIMESLKNYNYALDLSGATISHLDELAKWLQDNTGQQFVISDCGHPDARQAPSKEWETKIRELAKSENLCCKLSGLFTRGNRKTWKPADFYPFLEILFEAFGSERILFASEWPFLLISGMYVQWKSLVEKFMEKFPVEYHGQVFGANAQRIYHL